MPRRKGEAPQQPFVTIATSWHKSAVNHSRIIQLPLNQLSCAIHFPGAAALKLVNSPAPVQRDDDGE